MNLRRTITCAAVLGVLSLGAAGVAVADNGSGPTTTRPSNGALGPSPSAGSPAGSPSAGSPKAGSTCTAAGTRLQVLADLDHAAGLRLGLLQDALTHAQAKGNQTRITRLQARITKVTGRRQALESRMQTIEQRCSLPAPPAG